MGKLPFDLIDFDPANEEHASFANDTAWRSLSAFWPYCDVPRYRLLAALKREMSQVGTAVQMITPVGMPEDFVGWYACRPQEQVIVFCFVRWDQRRRGIATLALAAAGINLDIETKLVFWSPIATRIRFEHGYMGLVPGYFYRDQRDLKSVGATK